LERLTCSIPVCCVSAPLTGIAATIAEKRIAAEIVADIMDRAMIMPYVPIRPREKPVQEHRP
jgi:hypothetical protein